MCVPTVTMTNTAKKLSNYRNPHSVAIKECGIIILDYHITFNIQLMLQF
jgi:hypothetical protein